MKSNSMKNRSARERAKRRRQELEYQEAQRKQAVRNDNIVMWILAAGFCAVTLLLLATGAVGGLDLADSITYFGVAAILGAYSSISLILCRKHKIKEIVFQLSIMLFNAILMAAGTLFFILR